MIAVREALAGQRPAVPIGLDNSREARVRRRQPKTEGLAGLAPTGLGYKVGSSLLVLRVLATLALPKAEQPERPLSRTGTCRNFVPVTRTKFGFFRQEGV